MKISQLTIAFLFVMLITQGRLIAQVATDSLSTEQSADTLSKPNRGGRLRSPLHQRYEIRGQLTDVNGVPLSEVKVYILGTTLQTHSGRGGFYHLTGIPAGRHILRIQALGYEAQERQIIFGERRNDDSHQHEDFILTER